MPINKYVRILDAALDEDGDQLILRGRIDPQTLDAIQFDDYQREVQPISTINQIMKGFESGGSVPDTDLGMRGHRTRNDKDSYVLLDPTFGIDGQQRIQAAKCYLASGKNPRIGATIHFDTTKEWENNRFRILNADRIKVSPNVLVRNERENYAVVKTLYALCEDKSFALHNRVCWQQRKLRSHLLTATTVLKVCGQLHSHIGSGRGISRVDEMLPRMERTYNKVGRNTFRDNTKTYFQVVDDCWGIRTVTYDTACHLRNNFLFMLAILLSNHATFWRGNKLFVEMSLLRKLKLFPVHDPTVQQLAGGSGQSGKMLYQLMIHHLNRGKKTKRLVPRKIEEADEPLNEEQADAIEAVLC